jgi:2-keto-4-pentenoate hydratase/2-oxohepta-3-ene-1,7-dioic acid hydratase in catechol pathway
MRIARVEHDGEARVAVVAGDTVRVLEREVAVLDLLAGPGPERDRLAAVVAVEVPLEKARLFAPVQPSSFRDFVTFEEHVEGMVLGASPDAVVASEWYQAPTFYFTNALAVTGPYDDVPVPPGCRALDLELEVAAVVGRAGSDLSVETARDHIAGYTILNDWSARDLQAREMKVMLGPAKGKDFASTLGPWIVTADELEPYRRDDRLHLDLQAWVNGLPLGGDTLANMGWSFEEMLAYASRGTRVVPGDVIGSGTCGSGCLAELWGRRGRREPPPLQPGDVVRITVEAIGTIENRVVPGADPVPVPPARPPAQRRERG